LPPQVSGSQKREDKFDSYCLFHVAPDATLFKMFHLARVSGSQRRRV
jgi:hypothetical protein